MTRTISMLALLAALTTLGACTTTQKSAAVGSVAGAVIGGTTTGTLAGAAVGATIGGVTGAVAGELIGTYDKDPTKCVWEDKHGQRYLAACSPNG